MEEILKEYEIFSDNIKILPPLSFGGGVIDGQIQGIHLLATVLIDMAVVVCARFRVGLLVALHPRVEVVRRHGLRLVLRIVDR